MGDETKVVWVLGSGFSAPLGGPMLRDLLSLALHHEVAARYKKEGFGAPIMLQLLRLYHHGRKYPEGKVHPDDPKPSQFEPGELLWDDAEAFLDHLDTAEDRAKSDPAAAATIQRLLNLTLAGGHAQPTLEELSKAARRHIAAECCAFLERNLGASERWLPYEMWATMMLRPQDVVITFNYDCVLETINAKAGRRGRAACCSRPGRP